MGLGLAIGLALDFGGLIGQGDVAIGGGDSDASGGSDGGGESPTGSEGSDVLGSLSDAVSDAASAIGGIVDERRVIRVPLRNIPRALRMLPLIMPSLALAAEQAGSKGWGDRWAIYVGPIFTFSFFYVTIGGCIGGFNCFAFGGGIMFKSFGLGVLIPIGK